VAASRWFKDELRTDEKRTPSRLDVDLRLAGSVRVRVRVRVRVGVMVRVRVRVKLTTHSTRP